MVTQDFAMRWERRAGQVFAQCFFTFASHFFVMKIFETGRAKIGRKGGADQRLWSLMGR
jgi:hypothetical protein